MLRTHHQDPAYTTLHYQTTPLPMVSHEMIAKINQRSSDCRFLSFDPGKLSGNLCLCCSHATDLSKGAIAHTPSPTCCVLVKLPAAQPCCRRAVGTGGAQEAPHCQQLPPGDSASTAEVAVWYNTLLNPKLESLEVGELHCLQHSSVLPAPFYEGMPHREV